MTEENLDSIVKPRFNPKFRKRRKHDGMAIDGILGDQLEAFRPQVDSGLFCPKQCRKWQRWKDIDFTYELRDGTLYRLSWCLCGNLLKEEQL